MARCAPDERVDRTKMIALVRVGPAARRPDTVTPPTTVRSMIHRLFARFRLNGWGGRAARHYSERAPAGVSTSCANSRSWHAAVLQFLLPFPCGKGSGVRSIFSPFEDECSTQFLHKLRAESAAKVAAHQARNRACRNEKAFSLACPATTKRTPVHRVSASAYIEELPILRNSEMAGVACR